MEVHFYILLMAIFELYHQVVMKQDHLNLWKKQVLLI